MSNKKLLVKIDSFYKLASEFDRIVSNLKKSISYELSNGINAINHLFVSEIEASKSPGLQALDEIFGKLSELLNKIPSPSIPSDVGLIKVIADQMLTEAKKADFYTSKANSGMGYDPITGMGDMKSPAACLNRAVVLIGNLKKI